MTDEEREKRKLHVRALANLESVRSSTCYPNSRRVVSTAYWSWVVCCVVMIAGGGVALWQSLQPIPEGYQRPPTLLLWIYSLPVGIFGIPTGNLVREWLLVVFDCADSLVSISDSLKKMEDRIEQLKD